MYDDPGCSNLAQAVLRLTVSDFQEEELVVDAIAFAYGDTLEFWTAVVGIEPEAVRNRFVDLSVCSETRQVQQENIMRKVAFISEKGGVGKSTWSIVPVGNRSWGARHFSPATKHSSNENQNTCSKAGIFVEGLQQ